MTHHSYQHIGEYDDDGHVVESEEEHPHPLDHGGGVAAPEETVRVFGAVVLVRVFDLNAVDADLAEHRPEERVERARQSR